MARAVGCAVLCDGDDGRFPQVLGQRLGVGDGGGGGNEARPCAVEAGDAAEAAQDVGDVAAKDAAIGVEFVQDDVAQAAKKAHPASVVGEDADVEHVGVGDEDAGLFADGGAVAGGGVTIIGAQGNRGL